MKLYCPDSECISKNADPAPGSIIRKGFYYRKDDGQWIHRYRCKLCGKFFSSSALTARYRQKKRSLNSCIAVLLSSGISQRRLALYLHIDPKTVARKFRFEAQQAKLAHEAWLKSRQEDGCVPLQAVIFDDMETSEHTKLKPLSVVTAVEPKDRKILNFKISLMPAKGLSSQRARIKYGPRRDERAKGWNELFESLKPLADEHTQWISDENPHYPRALRRHFPKAKHIQHKGLRARSAGLGELKGPGHDPMFSINHSFAMFRANINRLFRKTWCTTKKVQALEDHLWLYIHFHNQRLTNSPSGAP